MVQLSYINANTRAALDMLPRVLTVERSELSMATSDFIPMKRCSKCGVEYPATKDNFCKDKNRKDGWYPYCRRCHRKTPLPEVLPPDMKRCSRCKVVKPKTSEFFSPRKSRGSGFDSRCRVCGTERYRDWRLNNPERMKRAELKWRGEHPEKIRKYSNDRKSIKNGLPGVFTQSEIEAQLKRQKGKCYYADCGHCDIRNSYEIEHVTPITRPGSRNDMSNIVLACRSCNSKKKDKLPHEWPEGGRLL